ncbi:MAG: transcriptional regulator [Hyphococcus sp.]|nr:MAG: transcriptional regulator [Marinicaulis sp.]
MKSGPNYARLAALIGDPARANMLSALMSGLALTARELAQEAGVQPSTASGHLKALTTAQLIECQKQGRHKYYRIANQETATAIESLQVLSEHNGLLRVRPGPKDPALRKARVCYDHLAGDMGVRLYESMAARDFFKVAADGISLTDVGEWFVHDFGVDVQQCMALRRPLCLACLDWSVRRHHLAGALGAAILKVAFDRDWLRRDTRSRLLRFTTVGEMAFREAFPIMS